MDLFPKSRLNHERPADMGLGIQPPPPSNRADFEAGEGEAHARDLQLNPMINEASSPADTKATHIDPGSGRNLTLVLDIYDDNNPSDYGQSP
jgi:hypothetical protein